MILHDLTALEIVDAVRTRQVSATDVAEHALRRAAELGPAVGAFVTLTPDVALAQSRALDDHVARGEADHLPLLGVPCPIKDLSPVAGVRFELGSAGLAGTVAEVDDGIVGWLREAGTVMVGKTTTPEFGLPCYTEPDNAPPARTPWDLRRSAGGSSGGAAAAVAARIVPLAHASDGGGSIRIPASACGLVGLKASRGRISSGPLRDPGPGLVSDGVVSRTVRDTALALDVLAGARPGDTYWAPAPAASFLDACDRPPARLRIGVLTDPVIAADAPVHPACLAAVAATARTLEALGHDVRPTGVPFPAERWQAFQALWSVGALSVPVPEGRESQLRPLTRWLRDLGRDTSGLGYALALAAVQRLTREVAQEWADVDVVLTPTLAQPPALIGALRDDADPAGDFAAQTRFTPWTSVANLTGRPSITLPLHTADVDGVRLPIGVMLTGRFGEDDVLLALSAALERPWCPPGDTSTDPVWAEAATPPAPGA